MGGAWVRKRLAEQKDFVWYFYSCHSTIIENHHFVKKGIVSFRKTAKSLVDNPRHVFYWFYILNVYINMNSRILLFVCSSCMNNVSFKTKNISFCKSVFFSCERATYFFVQEKRKKKGWIKKNNVKIHLESQSMYEVLLQE